jgi:septal ring factor EnvC (AmiA/AmiB activator)
VDDSAADFSPAGSESAIHTQPAFDPQLLAAQQQLAELSLHLQVVKTQLTDRESQAERLRCELAEVTSELAAVRKAYRCVGPATVSLANRIDQLKQRLPQVLSPLIGLARRFG